MSHNFVSGDTVRIGKGTVEYTVEDVYAGDMVKVRGGKANRAQDVEASRLKLVKAAARLSNGESVQGAVTVPEFYNEEVSWDLAVKNTAKILPHGTFVITDDNAPVEFKSFEAAAFALSRDHVYNRAVIVRDNVIKATR